MNNFWEKIQIMFKHRPDTEGSEWNRLSFIYWSIFFILLGIILITLLIFQLIRL